MFLVDKPTHILERQRTYQASHLPVYLRAPRSRLYISVFGAGFAVGIFGATYGVYSLLRGKPSAG